MSAIICFADPLDVLIIAPGEWIVAGVTPIT
jgi:hypothetical protein